MRAEARAAAIRWLGTPYHHQASVRGAGCDCLGLIRGIYGRFHFSHAVELASKVDSTGMMVDSTFFRVDFDRCAGAPTPAAADFACTVTTCMAGTTALPDCTCRAQP